MPCPAEVKLRRTGQFGRRDAFGWVHGPIAHEAQTFVVQNRSVKAMVPVGAVPASPRSAGASGPYKPIWGGGEPMAFGAGSSSQWQANRRQSSGTSRPFG
jgi:hypothetical protein